MNYDDPLMLRPSSMNEADMLADAAYPILLEGGARALTWRGLARGLRISVGTMGDWAPPRHESFRLVAARIGARWEQGIVGRLYREGYDAFMPRSDEEVDACKVWLAVEELGRSFPLVAFEVADAHERERALLQAQGTDKAEMLHVVLRGLRTALVDPARPMDRDRAQREWRNAVLRSHVDRVA